MRLIVHGRAPLHGHYQASGNSNEAVALIAASLLSTEQVTLTNVPSTETVRQMMDIAEDLGTSCTWEGDQLQLHTPTITSRQVGTDYTSRLVPAILFLAPILARREHATLVWTDSVGRLNTHLTAMRDLGLRVDIQGQNINITCQRWESKEIILLESSVTATAMVCMLASRLGKETIVHNAASEPHLRALQRMLGTMGAPIYGIGSNLLHIMGNAEALKGVSQSIQPDHIEIASIAAIGAVTPGYINIEPLIPADLRLISKVYERLGVQLIQEPNRLHVYEHQALMTTSLHEAVDITVDTATWPGFPSDLVAITTVLATQAHGTTLVHEKLFNNRLLFVDKLKSMGAQIVLCDPHRAVVIGPTPLRGEYIDTPDVRIGLGLLAAALCAHGDSVIDRAELIGRNFENVIEKLIGLGAAIEVQD